MKKNDFENKKAIKNCCCNRWNCDVFHRYGLNG